MGISEDDMQDASEDYAAAGNKEVRVKAASSHTYLYCARLHADSRHGLSLMDCTQSGTDVLKILRPDGDCVR